MITQNNVKLEDKDVKFVLGELYYTVSGAMKMMDCGRNKISDYINDGTLEVFRHPGGDLFSPTALRNWVAFHTIKAKKTR